MTRHVAIVPHTHWDREWYEPFQTFRLRLVDLLDELLPLIEQDGSYTRFMLDGQMAVVDDYLEVRPEAEGRIRALAASGRLTMGPWYILMDEFLVSGETIVRDLQLGIARGAAFGGVMEVGYLPDMFGHVAQMPQILRQAGFEHTVVWRGVPSPLDRSAFWWEAPDGSTVRAEYLPVGYGNGASIPDDAKALVRRIADHEREIGSFLLDGMLLMNGTDHQMPQPWLGRVVAEANALQDDFDLEVTSLAQYLATAPTNGLPHWKGELRSGHRSNVLMGVTSNRVDIKQAAARAERSLERRAEPACALFLPAGRWPARLLELAWLEMVRNAAHDSICACSIDEVDDAVTHRFAEARQIGDGLAARALKSLAGELPGTGMSAVNLAQRARGGLVELALADDQVPAAAQRLRERPGAFGLPRGLDTMSFDAQTVRTVLDLLPNGPQVDAHTWVEAVEMTDSDSGVDILVRFSDTEVFDVPMGAIKQELSDRLDARPDAVVQVRLDQPPTTEVLLRLDDVPAFGWAPVAASEPEHPVVVDEPAATGGPVVLTNGLVTVALDPADGTFSVDGVAGFGRLVDMGDHGDSYNYSPPLVDTVIDTPTSVSITTDERGPLRGRVSLETTYRWPERVDDASGSRVGAVEVTVASTVELRADEPYVRVRSSFVNPSRDHRLRVHLPLPEPAAGSRAECAFAVVDRPLEAEGRLDEFGLPTFPSRRFVQAGGLTVVHEGLLEYELVDIETTPEGPRARSLALTVLRSTGMLSRIGMTYRPLPAGPLTPVEGLQLVGRPIEASYALAVGVVDPYAMVDDVFLPLELVEHAGTGTRPASGSALGVCGAQVSAVRREAGALEVRVFNPADQPATVQVEGRSGWLVDLRGRPLEPFDGSFVLDPFAIATLRLADA